MKFEDELAAVTFTLYKYRLV